MLSLGNSSNQTGAPMTAFCKTIVQTMILRRPVMLILALSFGLLIASPSHANIVDSETAAGTKAGSKLVNDDRIIIWPKAILSANGVRDTNTTTFYNDCKSIYNRSKRDYFVPWKTDSEWLAFLTARQNGTLNTANGTVSVGHCCPTQVVEVCGVSIPATDGVAPELDTNLGQRTAGARFTPADPKDLLHYGATLDVKSMKSSVLLNNGLINYEVTYMCDQDGTWTKTLEVGSCEPIDGACNTQYTGSTITELPAENEWASSLCAKGSILHDPSGTGAGPFVTGTGPWDWQCDGTQNKAPAQCHASYNGCNTAIIPAKGFKKLPSDLSSLCITGNTSKDITPTVGNGPWDWQCQKNDNGFTSSCHAAYDPSFDGICNPAITGTLQTVIPLTKTGLCIGKDGITPADATADATCDSKTCTYVCAGDNGGNDTKCTASRQQNKGKCGSLAGSTPIAKPTDGDANLCQQGTPTTISGTDNGATWSWSCIGSPTPTAKACSAPNSLAAVNGVCNVNTLYTSSSTPVPADSWFCSKGTKNNFVRNNIGGDAELWTWTCDGANTGTDSKTCSAQYLPGQTGGICGSANNSSFASQPSASVLCGAGNTAQNIQTTSSPNGWSWTCNDTLYPAYWTNCKATSTIQPIAGACGSAQGGIYSVLASPPTAAQLCANGGLPNEFEWPNTDTKVATVTWGCQGINGGKDTSDTACSASFIPAIDGQCGIATSWTPNTLSVIQTASASQLCQPTAQSLPSNYAAYYDEATPANSTISWTCSKVSASGKDVSCHAQYVPAKQDAVCGVITDTVLPNSSAPSDSIICPVGGTHLTWTAPTAGSGAGTATWSCPGVYGGQSKSCSQVGIEVVDPNGQCGKANGVYVPDQPNYNLCANIQSAPTVYGGSQGPWSWVCGSSQVQCNAYPCKKCADSLANAFTNITVGSPTTKTIDQCTASGQPVWSADAQLQISNDVPVALQWTDAFNGAVSLSITPAPAPIQYCAPCYMKPTALLSGSTGALVQKISGTCDASITETPAIVPGAGLSP